MAEERGQWSAVVRQGSFSQLDRQRLLAEAPPRMSLYGKEGSELACVNARYEQALMKNYDSLEQA